MLSAFEMCHELSPSEHAAGGAFTGTDSWEQVQRKKDKRLQGSALRGVLDDFQETLSMSGRQCVFLFFSLFFILLFYFTCSFSSFSRAKMTRSLAPWQ